VLSISDEEARHLPEPKPGPASSRLTPRRPSSARRPSGSEARSARSGTASRGSTKRSPQATGQALRSTRSHPPT
jgi:hypothetical protein